MRRSSNKSSAAFSGQKALWLHRAPLPRSWGFRGRRSLSPTTNCWPRVSSKFVGAPGRASPSWGRSAVKGRRGGPVRFTCRPMAKGWACWRFNPLLRQAKRSSISAMASWRAPEACGSLFTPGASIAVRPAPISKAMVLAHLTTPRRRGCFGIRSFGSLPCSALCSLKGCLHESAPEAADMLHDVHDEVGSFFGLQQDDTDAA